MIEDPKKGLARLNKWKLEGREIAYRSVSPDPKNPHVFFASVRISKRICGLMQGQRGKVWIHGGQASVQWRNKALTEDLEVQFSYQ